MFFFTSENIFGMISKNGAHQMLLLGIMINRWILKILKYLIPGHPHLVGGLEHECYDFPYIGNVIIRMPNKIAIRSCPFTLWD